MITRFNVIMGTSITLCFFNPIILIIALFSSIAFYYSNKFKLFNQNRNPGMISVRVVTRNLVWFNFYFFVSYLVFFNSFLLTDEIENSSYDYIFENILNLIFVHMILGYDLIYGWIYQRFRS